MIAAIWAKISWWLGLAGAVALAIVGALLYGEHKGQQMGVADAAKQAVKDAQAARDTYADAVTAAGKVKADAAKQPAPDVVKRNDFDTTD